MTSERAASGARSVSVVGEATEYVTPDRCNVAFSLHVLRDTTAEAVAAVSELANAAISALRESGVQPAQVRTHNVVLQDWLDEPSRGRRVVGRVATYSFSVRQSTLEQAAKLIALLSDVAGDALKINGIGMTVEDTAEAQRLARQNAVLDAQRRGAQLAEAAGVQLGRVLSVEEGVAATGVRLTERFAARAVAASAGPPVPLEAGSEGVHSRVVVVFEIVDE